MVGSIYEILIKDLRTLCLSHKAVKSFRVGDISSIEQPSGNDGPNTNSYEYTAVHLVPSTAQMNGQSTKFEFDMVVFDLCKDDLDLQVVTQSQCLEITRDIISKFNLTDWDGFRYNIQLPTTSMVFDESFVNSVAGYTTRIVVEVISPFTLCENPFN